ncbi:MAG: methylmalonyl Co-A mutase-associated GTPase MeaB [Desulfobacula sp.]|jgi:LAO/AO transport system kinase|uniref:methylmalonyl Co-A mutase-associated GTPase MeaB n=1 Tax=Desulfobacula sp. TaxID=2593537 RepID=UPI001DC104E4|nr:methylmalonyl Co-A mutase-associated GTPase MeaB [Desulfobacula sp.]MBT3484227.1 methylmalonyl Co-A mutase-associated GTPase MeaB [Desulfobacula sp.]MBT3804299.1 methylmalonyl Co-A mutase-associated GTPase MeaB [Desulfobacula sp.]MBT4026263.1 methylmalonyl Co-A mutase-associated GTPase MeaB [Desulfobacula sp.]MBT4198153.1 methylmalonyl Co-A mutase-associated GTPase MeaB [Desulfobacula sp.]
MIQTDPESESFVQGILDGNRRMIAKTITLIESSLKTHQKKAFTVMEKILPHTGNSIRLGVTGVPGVGKSTFIENLGVYLADMGHKVAVLTIDPTSRRSGGSILGDKTRMEKLAAHKNAFIRPSPAGETLGGVAAKTREIMLTCEAAGFDVILIETVGVGQSETSVASMVDFFLVLMIAGAGDELQGIKKGVLELADGIAINKADGDNLKAVEKAKADLDIAMHLIRPESSNWTTPVLTCSSVVEGGTQSVWETILDHHEKFKDSGEFLLRRKKQTLEWMWTLVEEGLKQRFKENQKINKEIPVISRQVEDEKISPSAAAEMLLSYL